MNTVHVDLCYRPLRIAWAIRAGDADAFCRAVRLSHALWGGCFNPIVVVDHEQEADRLVDLYRVDFIVPVGACQKVHAFAQRFPHLINPIFGHKLFTGGQGEHHDAHVLDVRNILAHLRGRPEWKDVNDQRVVFPTWQTHDPLASVFSVQFGSYPIADEIGIDYRKIVQREFDATDCEISSTLPIPQDCLNHPNAATMARLGLTRHYSVQAGWHNPGFFVGDATVVDDLACHWNLCAADIPLWFVDPNHFARYSHVIPAWERRMRKLTLYSHGIEQRVAVWARRENLDEAKKLFGNFPLIACPVSIETWNGRNVCPPMMHFGSSSALGIIGQEGSRPQISFPLNDKPFYSDAWFSTQHLIASVSFIGRLDGDEEHTLNPPFLPELNEFYARTMHLCHDKVRSEPERIGLVICATEANAFLHAMPVPDLIARIFDRGGLTATPSSAGLITRQLITQLGGLQGTRPFKIPGVRRLVNTHGPAAAFGIRCAIQLIGGNDPDNPGASFEHHKRLYIEARPSDEKLTPQSVFAYLVEKGLFRIGAELRCPRCRMTNWFSLDALKQRVVCDLCGHEFNGTRQLVLANGWHYRRSGVFGVEKNVQGAIPVALVLQQLDANLHRGAHESMYSTSLELQAKLGVPATPCEIDFVWLISRRYPRRAVVILGECKDQGTIDANDVDNLRRIADSLPQHRFKTFVLLAKLGQFTPDEIAQAKSLNSAHEQRAILLTARELEPCHIYERDEDENGIIRYSGTPEELAQATAQRYFVGSS